MSGSFSATFGKRVPLGKCGICGSCKVKETVRQEEHDAAFKAIKADLNPLPSELAAYRERLPEATRTAIDAAPQDITCPYGNPFCTDNDMCAYCALDKAG